MDQRFKSYIKPKAQLMRPYEQGEVLPEDVSISPEDLRNGSPKVGDMIAVNADNENDQWLISQDFFEKNYAEDKYANPEGRELTFGEKAVGRRFNPSGDDEVDQCKLLFAKAIDQMNDLRNADGTKGRHASVAITDIETAQMRAVKAITWKE